MRKTLNTEAITNELAGGSAFFPGYRKEGSPAPPAKVAAAPRTPGTPVPPVRGERAVPPVPPLKRVMKQRHPFDIYRDQYDALRQLALEERKRGEIGSMSAMVRGAIDQLIATRRNTKT
jgi:hypothetical protein